MCLSVLQPHSSVMFVYKPICPLSVEYNESIIKGSPISNKNIRMSSPKSSENIQKKEGGPDISVSDIQSSSVTLNELAMKARKNTVISSFSKEVTHWLTLI